MELEDDFCIMQYESTCIEHSNKAVCALNIDYGGLIIPLCQSCIDDLYERILPHVSAEIRDKND